LHLVVLFLFFFLFVLTYSRYIFYILDELGLKFNELIPSPIAVDSHVCKDLVVYDKPYHNPFRNLIPFAKEYTCLLHIILATCAFHHSNALVRHSTQPTARQLPNLTVALTPKSESSLGASPETPEGVYQYALIAKQRALRLLSQALGRSDQTSTMVTLACVLLFIELELIDSGKNNWRPHVEGSRKLMEHLVSLLDIREISMDPLLDSLVSGCLVYVFNVLHD